MPIYTRTGDKGKTSLFDGTRVLKSHPRVETYGTVDELNSAIGFAIAHMAKSKGQRVKKELEKIQHDLFVKAKKFLRARMDEAKNLNELKKKIKEGKIVKAYMVDDPKIEDEIKFECDGAASRIVEESNKEGICVKSGKKTRIIAYFAKAY